MVAIVTTRETLCSSVMHASHGKMVVMCVCVCLCAHVWLHALTPDPMMFIIDIGN